MDLIRTLVSWLFLSHVSIKIILILIILMVKMGIIKLVIRVIFLKSSLLMKSILWNKCLNVLPMRQLVGELRIRKHVRIKRQGACQSVGV